jgi:hypothetical protein
MRDATVSERTESNRRGIALAAVGLAMTAATLATVAAAAEAPLQVSYSTDPYMTCDALQEESQRMDAFLAAKGATAALLKTARDRKQHLGEILKGKSCAPAPAKTFGPDMYDLPGTAPVKR